MAIEAGDPVPLASIKRNNPVARNLVEAYMNRGDRGLAIKNYQKSLELNPRNFGAVAALEKLRAKK